VRPLPSGTTKLLAALAPYQNSNRIPLTIVDALHSGRYVLPGDLAEAGTSSRATAGSGTARDLNPLIDAVTYCMQSDSASYLRQNAIDFLSGAVGGPDMKYFKRKRLTKLDLPGQQEIPLHRKTLSVAKQRLVSKAKRTQHVLKVYGITVDPSKLRKNG
jgi:hypothetical protein